jgi:hypothetical protein
MSCIVCNNTNIGNIGAEASLLGCPTHFEKLFADPPPVRCETYSAPVSLEDRKGDGTLSSLAGSKIVHAHDGPRETLRAFVQSEAQTIPITSEETVGDADDLGGGGQGSGQEILTNTWRTVLEGNIALCDGLQCSNAKGYVHHSDGGVEGGPGAA